MTDSWAAQSDQRRHVTTNIWFQGESEDAATVVSYLTIGSVADGRLTMLSTGYYRDRVVNRDGRWRFLERDLSLDAPY